ncbi:MAG: hypothetical protein RMK19_01350 [Bacteroidia bacterium]|nr:hypothetical protein [Bacteroidia bacterium]MDW8014641.1 hypothetical protein [Bacteroidia bacterium]
MDDPKRSNPQGVIVIGTGLLARWVAQLLEVEGELVYGFSPPRTQPKKEQDMLGILPPITKAHIWKLLKSGEADYIIALTDPVARERMAIQLFERVKRPPRNCIHKSVFLSPTAQLGGGLILFPYVAIGLSAQIGGHVVVESHTSIGAETHIHDFVNIGSGCHIGEQCVIESYVWIGRGAVIEAGVKIGKGAQILPGTTVRTPVRPGAIYEG